MKVGSLCTGYGGLDLAVDGVLGTTLEWVCEFDTHASKVCDARFPDVPNLHDLTAVDWSTVPPVDVLTAGYPCQPFSHAGRRQGANDVRHLWPFIAGALDVLRPRLVVLENVAGHLSLGFDRVLGDLAELGFDAEWCVVRASDVGACHRRARLFIVATDTSSTGAGRDARAVPRAAQEGRRARADIHAAGDAGQNTADAHDGTHDGQRPRTAPRRGDQEPAHADRQGVEGLRRTGSRGRCEPVRAGQDAPHANLSSGKAWDGRSWPGDAGRPQPVVCGDTADADTERSGRDGWAPDQGGRPESRTAAAGIGEVDWGGYRQAITRHELTIGRPAPRPTDDRGRLSPRFVEWMMMLPDGWVTDLMLPDTDPRPDRLSRAQALKILGNGVVPPQAAYAIAGLLERMDAWSEAA